MSGDIPAEEFAWYAERMPPWRTEMIARTETIRASNAGSDELFRQWGVPEKEWIATQDDRVRTLEKGEWGHLEADGQRVGMNEMFVLKGPDGERVECQYPGDPSLPLAAMLNCRCSELPVVD